MCIMKNKINILPTEEWKSPSGQRDRINIKMGNVLINYEPRNYTDAAIFLFSLIHSIRLERALGRKSTSTGLCACT